MPLWICAVVGTGVAKSEPGTDLVATAGTLALGVEPRWQASQVVDDGMCELAPTGVVLGMTMIFVTPMKLVLVMLGPWHDAQLVEMPLWLMREPENFAPLGTGVVVTLEPVPTWQTSHDAAVGMWLLGRPTMLKPADGIAKLAAAVPWHCAQLLVVLGALAWMLASVGITAKSLEVWQSLQVALAEVGMWLAGLSVPTHTAVPLWQVEQSPVVGCAASAMLKVLPVALGREWKPV